MHNLHKIFFLSVWIFVIASCAKSGSVTPEIVAPGINSIGCADNQSQIFDSMYSYLDNLKSSPDNEGFKALVNQQIDSLAEKQSLDPAATAHLKNTFDAVVDFLLSDVKNAKHIADPKDHLRSLIELEMHDQSSELNKKLNLRFSQTMQDLQESARAAQLKCSSDSSHIGGNSDASPGSGRTPSSILSAGINNVFATAYQSCDVLQVPVLDAGTPDVIGITRTDYSTPGNRVISNLREVQSTDPYIKASSGNNQSQCFDVKDNPLIYAYGGEPGITNNTIDFFVDAAGLPTLGVDCSAYVSSIIAASGMKYRPNQKNKAIYIRQTSSKFINAQDSGFTCFQNVDFGPTSTIQPGDILGIDGHVIMVESTGSDPFGLSRVSSSSHCAELSIHQFDFIITQSSPSKNGIGINKYSAKDYLNESEEMGTPFLAAAKIACQAKFSGKTLSTINAHWGLLRHKGTPECLAPPVAMNHQACVQNCFSPSPNL